LAQTGKQDKTLLAEMLAIATANRTRRKECLFACLLFLWLYWKAKLSISVGMKICVLNVMS